jgi:hypothetical protein
MRRVSRPSRRSANHRFASRVRPKKGNSSGGFATRVHPAGTPKGIVLVAAVFAEFGDEVVGVGHEAHARAIGGMGGGVDAPAVEVDVEHVVAAAVEAVVHLRRDDELAAHDDGEVVPVLGFVVVRGGEVAHDLREDVGREGLAYRVGGESVRGAPGGGVVDPPVPGVPGVGGELAVAPALPPGVGGVADGHGRVVVGAVAVGEIEGAQSVGLDGLAFGVCVVGPAAQDEAFVDAHVVLQAFDLQMKVQRTGGARHQQGDAARREPGET